jgi:hypothetical protein
MSSGGRRHCIAGAVVLGIVVCGGGAASGEEAAQGLPASPQAARRASVETVHFSDRRHGPVKVVRVSSTPAGQPPRQETVSFGTGEAAPVMIVRGAIEPLPAPEPAPSRQAALAPHKTVERIDFAGPEGTTVTVVRGTSAVREMFSADLFGPAGAGELDRVAHAVHGAESSYGADPRMWRPEFDGPQGPMQVSAAAALDVGGGNRFDIYENRQLGRAYLARMFRRYGNWPDALAAYNWGPGNVDRWIAGGRSAARLPLETTRYIERVLRDALITTVARRL